MKDTKGLLVLLLFLLLLVGLNHEIFADDDLSDSSTGKVENHKKKLRGKVTREKEAEGTKAPNRFDSEAVFKSEYKLNGQSLEVDTD